MSLLGLGGQTVAVNGSGSCPVGNPNIQSHHREVHSSYETPSGSDPGAATVAGKGTALATGTSTTGSDPAGDGLWAAAPAAARTTVSAPMTRVRAALAGVTRGGRIHMDSPRQGLDVVGRRWTRLLQTPRLVQPEAVLASRSVTFEAIRRPRLGRRAGDNPPPMPLCRRLCRRRSLGYSRRNG